MVLLSDTPGARAVSFTTLCIYSCNDSLSPWMHMLTRSLARSVPAPARVPVNDRCSALRTHPSAASTDQGVPDVLLRHQRGLRGGRWCWSNQRRDGLLLWHRAGDLTLEQSEIPLSLPDVEVDGVWSGMRRRRALLLGRLRLRRRQPHLLLLLGRDGLAHDEGPYTS
jgi:hypothetical protein